MSADHPKFINAAQAGEDLSGDQYRLVKEGATAGQFIVCTGATDIPRGVCYDTEATAAGQGVDIASLTTSDGLKVKVGVAGVVAGWVGTDANGELVNKSANNDYAIGWIDQAWAAGEIAEVRPQAGYLSLA